MPIIPTTQNIHESGSGTALVPKGVKPLAVKTPVEVVRVKSVTGAPLAVKDTRVRNCRPQPQRLRDRSGERWPTCEGVRDFARYSLGSRGYALEPGFRRD
jgi:hypothetical protein